jgi:hypothetical protein
MVPEMESKFFLFCRDPKASFYREMYKQFLGLKLKFESNPSVQLVMNGLRLGLYGELEKRGFTAGPTGSLSLSRSLLCSALCGAAGSLGNQSTNR